MNSREYWFTLDELANSIKADARKAKAAAVCAGDEFDDNMTRVVNLNDIVIDYLNDITERSAQLLAMAEKQWAAACGYAVNTDEKQDYYRS